MSDPLKDALRRQREKNEPLDLSLTELLVRFLMTSRGWIVRQIIKLATAPLAALAAWLEAKGVNGNNTAAIILGCSAAVTATAEMILSFIAAKFARKAQPIDD